MIVFPEQQENALNSCQVCQVFNETFQDAYQVNLIGGANEPLYLPATESNKAQIRFREDFVSSAMHEISHWVVAGEKRRMLEDYGYWYESDGRNYEQQKAFEQVEVTPQSVELFLHLAAGLKFDVSLDNLYLPDYDRTPFITSVQAKVLSYLSSKSDAKLPARAITLMLALFKARGVDLSSSDDLMQYCYRLLKPTSVNNK